MLEVEAVTVKRRPEHGERQQPRWRARWEGGVRVDCEGEGCSLCSKPGTRSGHSNFHQLGSFRPSPKEEKQERTKETGTGDRRLSLQR